MDPRDYSVCLSGTSSQTLDHLTSTWGSDVDSSPTPLEWVGIYYMLEASWGLLAYGIVMLRYIEDGVVCNYRAIRIHILFAHPSNFFPFLFTLRSRLG